MNLRRVELEAASYDDNGKDKPILWDTIKGLRASKHYVSYMDFLPDPDEQICNDILKTTYEDFKFYCGIDPNPTTWARCREMAECKHELKLQELNASTAAATTTTNEPTLQVKKSDLDDFKRALSVTLDKQQQTPPLSTWTVHLLHSLTNQSFTSWQMRTLDQKLPMLMRSKQEWSRSYQILKLSLSLPMLTKYLGNFHHSKDPKQHSKELLSLDFSLTRCCY